MTINCKFYYEDTYRQGARKECRLVGRNPESEPWHEGLCRRCPVPLILERNPCANLILEGRVGRRFGLFSRVEVYAVCTKKLAEVKDPIGCRKGCPEYREA